MKQEIRIQTIGIVHSCFSEKFGVPRQPGLVKSAKGRLELLEPFNREEMVKGLEEFSHVWLQFLFHETLEEGWKPTIRPPRLGGKKRVGVFASRSPHRPNFLGMSVVRLEGIVREKKGLFLELAEVDLLDKTPIVDIKPYLPYSDRVEGASSGYLQPDAVEGEVEFEEEVMQFCKEYRQKTGRNLRTLITEVLAQDPRPASQRKVVREFGMLLWDVNVRWRAEDKTCVVLGCERLGS